MTLENLLEFECGLYWFGDIGESKLIGLDGFSYSRFLDLEFVSVSILCDGDPYLLFFNEAAF